MVFPLYIPLPFFWPMDWPVPPAAAPHLEVGLEFGRQPKGQASRLALVVGLQLEGGRGIQGDIAVGTFQGPQRIALRCLLTVTVIVQAPLKVSAGGLQLSTIPGLTSRRCRPSRLLEPAPRDAQVHVAEELQRADRRHSEDAGHRRCVGHLRVAARASLRGRGESPSENREEEAAEALGEWTPEVL